MFTEKKAKFSLWFLFSFLVSSTQAATCSADQQPYKNYCISNKMADLIACIDMSGGNKEQLVSFLDHSIGDGSANQAAIVGGNKVVSGNAKISLSKEKESRVIEALGAKYFSGAMHECASYAKDISSSSKNIALPVKEKSANVIFPIKVIASGDVVTFFPGFSMNVVMISGDPEGLYRVKLLSQESGTISMATNDVPEEVAYKGINYYISATKNEYKQVVLKLSKK